MENYIYDYLKVGLDTSKKVDDQLVKLARLLDRQENIDKIEVTEELNKLIKLFDDNLNKVSRSMYHQGYDDCILDKVNEGLSVTQTNKEDTSS
ncbi:hypothetical protein P9294_gp216 [Bacillus phage FADO]|uniref:Uncharacterized protein n=1 Tax=Bacillus phage FADO TaxID=2917160 RepID=A0AAE9GAI1_9CAUD|nr:hypothetical protein P9294_gp216 [Bacillus phage FADO]UNY48931.1 hypothetical protein fado_216 [Bacillus phage FADO]